MMGSLIKASSRVVVQPQVLVPTIAAVLLALAATPFLDAGNAHQVRTGVATLLACALAATAEDPAGEVTAASPHPPRVRCGVRLLLGLALVLPVAILTLTLIAHQVDGAIRTPGAAVQMLAILAVGPAIGFAVWAWGDMTHPSYAAMTGVLCCCLAMLLLPTSWSVIKVQPWGPPWEAAMVRWCAMLCLGAAIVASTWRDPAVNPKKKRHVPTVAAFRIDSKQVLGEPVRVDSHDLPRPATPPTAEGGQACATG